MTPVDGQASRELISLVAKHFGDSYETGDLNPVSTMSFPGRVREGADRNLLFGAPAPEPEPRLA